MKFTKKLGAKLYYIPENKNVTAWDKIARWRHAHLLKTLPLSKYNKLKESDLLHLIEFNPRELRVIQSINNVYKIWVETGKIPSRGENRDVARIAKYKKNNDVLSKGKIQDYVNSLGEYFLLETRDRVKIAHDRLLEFINYYKKLGGYPGRHVCDKTIKYWGGYLGNLKSSYKNKSNHFLDDWMIKECDRNNISLRTKDYTQIAHDTLLEFITYYTKLGYIPSSHSKNKIEKRWADYWCNLRSKCKNKKGRNYLDDWMINELSKIGVDLNAGGRFIRSTSIIDTIIINFPDIDTFMHNLYNSSRYCLLYARLRKKSTGVYKELYPYANKVLSDHYHIKDFLSYSYSELREMIKSGKIKSKENKDVKSNRKGQSKVERKSSKSIVQRMDNRKDTRKAS